MKIEFFDLFGVGGAGWRCRFFFFLNTAISFFFLHFLMRKIENFLMIRQKAPFCLVEIQKVMEILKF
jgi:hypothetical protein